MDVVPHADVLQYLDDEPDEVEGDPTLLNELSMFEYFEKYQDIESDDDDSDAEFVENSKRNHKLSEAVLDPAPPKYTEALHGIFFAVIKILQFSSNIHFNR